MSKKSFKALYKNWDVPFGDVVRFSIMLHS
jgi:hypothetical protein